MGAGTGGLEGTRRVTTVERKSGRELVVTRVFDAAPGLVFEAWVNPDHFKRWWLPRSMGMVLVACEMDVRTGGGYRLDFGGGMEFYGRYTEVTVPSRIVWTNDEGAEAGPVTTVTFEDVRGQTLLVMTESYPSSAALDGAGTGAADATQETFAQLDELLAELGSIASG